MTPEQDTTLAASDGVTLQGRLGLPAGATAGLVACHPHPLYGGDMENPVVVRVADVFGALGCATLRFNFRGVGGSGGAHEGGPGELRDVEAALAHLRAMLEGQPLLLAGYSFGATISAQVAVRPEARLAGLLLIAPPLALTGPEPFLGLAAFGAPMLVVAGSQDAYCPRAELDGLARRLPGADVAVMDGVNHFFFGKLFPLGEAVATWARPLVAGEAGRRRSAG
jgi:alpha/beta superfamily hydrolase